MSKHNFVVNGPKFTKFFVLNAEEMAVDNAVYRLPICPEIFAVKVGSCLKSRRILDVFCLPKF